MAVSVSSGFADRSQHLVELLFCELATEVQSVRLLRSSGASGTMHHNHRRFGCLEGEQHPGRLCCGLSQTPSVALDYTLTHMQTCCHISCKCDEIWWSLNKCIVSMIMCSFWITLDKTSISKASDVCTDLGSNNTVKPACLQAVAMGSMRAVARMLVKLHMGTNPETQISKHSTLHALAMTDVALCCRTNE